MFVIPLLVVRTLMMAGTWGQHAFVDARAPGNPFKNSITCIDTRYEALRAAPGAPARDDAAAIAFMKSRTQHIAATGAAKGAAKAVEETA